MKTYLLRLAACLFLCVSLNSHASMSLTVNIDYLNDPGGVINGELGINLNIGSPVALFVDLSQSPYVPKCWL